jgi:hypothetical protein
VILGSRTAPDSLREEERKSVCGGRRERILGMQAAKEINDMGSRPKLLFVSFKPRTLHRDARVRLDLPEADRRQGTPIGGGSCIGFGDSALTENWRQQ